MIITNPPFAIAMNVIQKALRDVKMGGYVIMLLRLNFVGSDERFAFFKDNMPEYIFVHHKRICFCEQHDKDGYLLFGKNGQPKRGSTDSIEYAHMIWRKGYNPETAKLKVI